MPVSLHSKTHIDRNNVKGKKEDYQAFLFGTEGAGEAFCDECYQEKTGCRKLKIYF